MVERVFRTPEDKAAHEELWDRSGYTKEHRRTFEKVQDAQEAEAEMQELKGEVTMRARANRQEADKLEKEFKAKVDKMERTGEPDPNPDATRDLGRRWEEAAQRADRSEQNLRDTEHKHQQLKDELDRAYNENEVEKARDPQWQKEQEYKNRKADADDDVDTDGTSVAVASAADTDADGLGDTSGFVGDDDVDLAAVTPTADLDGGTAPASTLSGEQGDGMTAEPTDPAFDTQYASADDMSGAVESAGDSAGAETWAESDQMMDSQVAAVDAPAEPEFEEFVDDSAGTTG